MGKLWSHWFGSVWGQKCGLYGRSVEKNWFLPQKGPFWAIGARKRPAEQPNGHLPENQRYPELAQDMGKIWFHWVRSVWGQKSEFYERSVKKNWFSGHRWAKPAVFWRVPGVFFNQMCSFLHQMACINPINNSGVVRNVVFEITLLSIYPISATGSEFPKWGIPQIRNSWNEGSLDKMASRWRCL